MEEDKEKLLGRIIFDEECEEIIYKMWKRRERIMKDDDDGR